MSPESVKDIMCSEAHKIHDQIEIVLLCESGPVIVCSCCFTILNLLCITEPSLCMLSHWQQWRTLQIKVKGINKHTNRTTRGTLTTLHHKQAKEDEEGGRCDTLNSTRRWDFVTLYSLLCFQNNWFFELWSHSKPMIKNKIKINVEIYTVYIYI